MVKLQKPESPIGSPPPRSGGLPAVSRWQDSLLERTRRRGAAIVHHRCLPVPRGSDRHPAHSRAKRQRENNRQARPGTPQVPCRSRCVGFRPSSPKIRISMTRNSSSRRPIWTVGRSRPGTKVRTRELNSKIGAKSASVASKGVGKSTPGEGRKPRPCYNKMMSRPSVNNRANLLQVTTRVNGPHSALILHRHRSYFWRNLSSIIGNCI